MHDMKRQTRLLAAFLQSALLVYGFTQSKNPNYASRSTPNVRATTKLLSVPNSIDTFTSGLASIARLPRGVTVSDDCVSMIGPAAAYLPKLKKLFDIENSKTCRRVRERITELDLVVEQVIPAAENSRVMSLPNSPDIVPTLVVEASGEEETIAGEANILNYLNEKFSTEKEQKKSNDDENTAKLVVLDIISQATAFFPGVLRAGRGAVVCSAASSSFDVPRPSKPLVLYSYEGNQFCRLVREVLTELDIVYELRSAGKGSPRRDELGSITGGSTQCPFLIDPNSGVKMPESKDIIQYLYKEYAAWTPPSELLRTASNVITPLLKPLYKVIAPLQAGSSKENELEYKNDIAEAKAEIYAEILSAPVVMYTYQYSPFCSEAKTLLDSMGITFKEVSLGLEWIPGLIKEPRKRAALLEITGQSSLPHIFIGGSSIGGLFSGTPGLVPALEQGSLTDLVEDAETSTSATDSGL